MRNIKKVILYWFSGSGNTLMIAKEIKKVFEEKEIEVDLRNMVTSSYEPLEKDEVLALGFPVAIQSTNHLVWDFIYNLPKDEGRKVFMFDTMEYFSGGIVGPLKKVLEDKGYDCIAAKEFKMSSSMMVDQKKELSRDDRNEKAIKEVKEFVESIIDGKSKWRRVPLASDLMRKVSLSDSVWEKMSTSIQVEEEDCIKCGLCSTSCPSKSISLSPYPVINNKTCLSCMRCVNICPKNAFRLKGKLPCQSTYSKQREFFIKE